MLCARFSPSIKYSRLVATDRRGLDCRRMRAKTAAFEAQFRELALLHDSAVFLQGCRTVDSMCAGFLDRVSRYFVADASTVELVDGQVVQRGPRGATGDTVSVVQIVSQDRVLGVFSLHFHRKRSLGAQESMLLDILGRLLGTAIQNTRLAAREREMARSEERNELARALHDSIAQGLNFLKLQVQMLEESLRHGRQQEAADIIPLLRTGLAESYEDLRTLLRSFRSRVEDEDLHAALGKAVAEFRDHTGIDARFVAEGEGGAAVGREQQLQILFILQEALSNIRRHANADKVEVCVRDSRDFSLTISDNGAGFDPTVALAAEGARLGLRIMRERARHINAELSIEAGAGAGTTIRLHLASAHGRPSD